MKQESSSYRVAFAIVRIDRLRKDVHGFPAHEPDYFSEQDWQLRVRVKAIVVSEEAAAQEVERLNELNAGKGCLYISQRTRVYEV